MKVKGISFCFIDSVSESGDCRYSLSHRELRWLELMLQGAVLKNCCLGWNASLISLKACAFASTQVCGHGWIPGISVEIVAKTTKRLMSEIRFSSSICQERFWKVWGVTRRHLWIPKGRCEIVITVPVPPGPGNYELMSAPVANESGENMERDAGKLFLNWKPGFEMCCVWLVFKSWLFK